MSRFSSVYQGWKTHAGAFACAMIISGTTSYTFGLFVIPASEDLGINRATVNNAFIVYLAAVALLSPFAGRLLDKFSARLLVGIAGPLFGIGMAAIAFTDHLLLMLAMVAGPISIGTVLCGSLAANTVVVRWFRRRRGAALGILAVSTSVGGAIFTPLVALLIENLGWRGALVTTGLIAGSVIPLMALLMIRNRPSGSEPGHAQEFAPDTEAGGQGTQPEERLWSYAELVRSRNFWLVSIGITLLFASDQALMVSAIPHFQDIGIDTAGAALIASCMALSAIAGKLTVGYLADRVDLRLVFHAVALAHIGLLAIYILAPGYWLLLSLATVCGIGIGGVFPVWSTLLGWLFGARSYGTIMGLMAIPMKLSGVLTVRLVGEIHVATGSYATAFMLFGAGIALSMLAISLVRPPRAPDADQRERQDPVRQKALQPG